MQISFLVFIDNGGWKMSENSNEAIIMNILFNEGMTSAIIMVTGNNNENGVGDGCQMVENGRGGNGGGRSLMVMGE